MRGAKLCVVLVVSMACAGAGLARKHPKATADAAATAEKPADKPSDKPSDIVITKAPPRCQGPDDQTFYVNDVQIITDKPYGPRVIFALRVDDPDTADVFFTLPTETPEEKSLAESTVAMIAARVKDATMGVEPKLKTGQTGDGKTPATAYVMGSVSTGLLPGLCPPGKKEAVTVDRW